MSRPARLTHESKKGSLTGLATFGIGIPLGVGTLLFIHRSPLVSAEIKRYVEHPVEHAVIILFFCCLTALFLKMLGCLKERYVHGQKLLPVWDGKPVPIADVRQLQQALNLVWDRVQTTYLGRRVANILNFVENRGSASDLDDQMRTLADNDALAMDSSYALMRFINWSIPILGFLGTVLGITSAISGVSPQSLEQDLGKVTGGLSEAFDTTALALGLTMISMFCNYLIEKLEQGLLDRVDQYVDAELAHRFLRTLAETDRMTAVLQENSQVFAQGLQQLLEKQADLFSQSGSQAQEKLAGLMQQAFETSLAKFGQRLAETEKKLLDRHQAMLDGVSKLAIVMKDSGGEHRLALARLTDAIGLSVEMVTKVQTNEAQLLRQQETLNQNLTLLANSATFEQAVESLTAAIHLLTTRVQPQQGSARVLPMKSNAA